MQEARKPIVIIGSVTMDMVAHAPQIPRVGETVIGTGFHLTPGGKGANQAVAVARLAYPVQMVGLVGEDIYGPALLQNLADVGVDTASMARVPGDSGLAPIFLSAAGENSIIVIPGANGKMSPEIVEGNRALIAAAGMVLCQLELPMQTLNHTLDLCTEYGVPAMLDPAPAAPLDAEVWRRVAWFTPNETEAAFYVNEDLSPEETVRLLRVRGLRGIVLKRGADGAFVADASGRAEWVAGFAVEAVDTVGAGDCFNGAFAVALMEGMDPWTAARFANAAAALSVTGHGAQGALPSRAAVDAFLAGAN